jgi:hypothetical protein
MNSNLLSKALVLLVSYRDYTGDFRMANLCGEVIEELKAELAKPEMPTKIFGPNLEEILNAAGFYRRDMDTKQENVDTSGQCTHKLDKFIHEPVAWMTNSEQDTTTDYLFSHVQSPIHTIPLYAAPQNKKWVGLTDEEIENIVDINTSDDGGFDIWCDGIGVAQLVISKLKEKNHD